MHICSIASVIKKQGAIQRKTNNSPAFICVFRKKVVTSQRFQE